jgi:stage II sporulation protein R
MMKIFTKPENRGRALVALAFALVTLVLLAATFLPVHGEAQIYDAVLRLHVIANSDSERDQQLKLAVRDAVLDVTTEHLRGCADRDEAAARLALLRAELEAVAKATLRAQGCELPVAVALGEEDYPTRSYESFCFPSGEYLSLRVMIGEAEGENFWCVLFPPLCTRAAEVSRGQAEQEFVSVGLSRDQYAIITETEQTQYRVRFRLLSAR